MKYQDIPDMIKLTHLSDEKTWVSLGYWFNGKPKLIEIQKDESDENWQLMEGKITPWRGYMVAIKEEETAFNKRQALAEMGESELLIPKEKMDMLKRTGTAFFSPLHR